MFGTVPSPALKVEEDLLLNIALGVTAGAVTTMLIQPSLKSKAFKVLLGTLLVDAILLGAAAVRRGGI